MQPQLIHSKERRLIGKRTRMSFNDNRTLDLWRSFMPKRKEIINKLNENFYSIEIYDSSFFKSFNPEADFEKWAAIEVGDFVEVPKELETITIPEGLYAVFIHKGPASEGYKTFKFIFENWLPASGYEVDHRPHFGIMGEKYKQDDPDSEEELWIPIVVK